MMDFVTVEKGKIMAEYIDKEVAIEAAKHAWAKGLEPSQYIEIIQTIDVVPVVRCSECKYHRDKNEHEKQYLVEDILICTSQDATDDCWNAVWPNHFCSYGERKEGVG